MMDIALLTTSRNPATGCFDFVRGPDGDVLFDDTEAHAVITSALEHKGAYWADRNHGSDLFRMKTLSTKTPSQADAMVREAEDPLVADGSIAPPSVTASVVRKTGRLNIDIDWTTPGGVPGSVAVDV
jgi:phage gp46-like protein